MPTRLEVLLILDVKIQDPDWITLPQSVTIQLGSFAAPVNEGGLPASLATRRVCLRCGEQRSESTGFAGGTCIGSSSHEGTYPEEDGRRGHPADGGGH